MNAFVLAGGKNERFGSNKALARLGAETMIEKIIDEISPFFNKIFIISKNPKEYEFLKFDVKQDIFPDCGPLGGIHTGLVLSKSFKSFFIACDMPEVDNELLKKMIIESADYDVIVPKNGKNYEPLFAIYSKNCIKPVEQQIKKGNFKVSDFYNLVKVKEIPSGKIVNINTQEELKEYKK